MSSDPALLLQRAEALHNQGRVEEADRLYQDLITQAPQSPEAAKALTNRGVIAQGGGRTDEALDLHGRALALVPGLAEGWCNRGDLFSDLGRWNEAQADFARAAKLSPQLLPAWFNLGNARLQLGEAAAAEVCYRRALELAPHLPVIHAQLARCLDALGRAQEAADAMEAASRLAPGDWRMLTDLGALQQQAGRITAAKESLRSAISLNPAHASAHYNLGNVFYGEGRATEACACWQAAWTMDTGLRDAASNYLNGLHYLPKMSGEETGKIHRQMMERMGAPTPSGYANTPDPGRVIRVGYVSADLRRHPLGLLMRPVLKGHDPARIFAACYSTRSGDDDITPELRRHAALWRDVAGLDAEALARLIQDDGMDILVDLDGQTAGNRLDLFARKPAPVQISWLGYPFTTGLAAMDYALMDRATVPPEAEGWFSETVLLLPGSRLCYQGAQTPEPQPPPMLRRGHVTFGSFNNIAKLNGQVVASWARILHRVPGSRLVLKWPHLAWKEVASPLREAFAAQGIDPDRLELRGNSPPSQLLAEYGDVDIALDPFPYCGAFTSCEALWMGVPVVTLAGPRPFSRQSLALLSAMGLEGDLARFDLAEYEDLAVSLAANLPRLEELRRELRPAMRRTIGDSAAHLAALEQVFRQVWTAWCVKIKGEA
ncbi:TPR domain protein putative component of TonB system [Paramagnetospirillum magnetotacticum MS-1]|uniref:protein O-GlcNAc transferase n=1 Tax=Paramagnetospirillum magnetotacticum MS-1 TaxID=272627 RepID=A0A0C2UC20_PARME|nr:glycosyltransferase family 41 protein [Paramagnetospirillum magnetotacticum]KIL99047.1 TPR domain protein putative component of TonB system [Paramagnetospirillum magnetotacticum MS-1]